MNNPSRLEDNVLYTLDKCFRAYHQYAQKQVKAAGYSITIDQWLLLKNVADNPVLPQNELAKLINKDNASVTRMMQLLVDAGLLKRQVFLTDRRRVKLVLTPKGADITRKVEAVAVKNRLAALEGICPEEIGQLKGILNKILNNCKNK